MQVSTCGEHNPGPCLGRPALPPQGPVNASMLPSHTCGKQVWHSKWSACLPGEPKRRYIYTEKNYKRNTFVFAPFFMSWTQRSKTFSMYTKGLFLSNIVHKSVYICVSEHFSFAEIIHPPHRCGISRCYILEWSFIVASLRHTSAIIMLTNQHLDMPHLWGGWKFKGNRPFVYIEKVLNLWV